MNSPSTDIQKIPTPESTSTPMLKQYYAVKAKHPDCIVLFRLGDFYEMFDRDAEIASKILDVVLTARGKGTPNCVAMCGFPHHASDNYIAKLIKAGYKTAICEQLENPADVKGIVKRDVTRVITAGTFLDDNSVESRYLACLTFDTKNVGIAWMDASEGTIQTQILPNHPQSLLEFLNHWNVHECHVAEKYRETFQKLLKCFKN